MNSNPENARESGSRPKRGSALRKWSLRLLLVAFGCLVSLLFLEFGLRVAGIGTDQMMQADPVVGVRFIPSKSGQQQKECYKAHVSINSEGWRSPEIALEKPKDVYRVLILGDSLMAALQVEDDETFASLLQEQLNQSHPPRRVEVLNMSVPSWGTDQEYVALREYGLGYAPDLVLLALYPQNDIYDNAPALHSKVSVDKKPFFDLKDGELIKLPFVDTTPAIASRLRRMAATFRLYPFVRDRLMTIPIAHKVMFRLHLVKVRPEEPKRHKTRKELTSLWPSRWRNQLGAYVIKKEPPEWKHAWEITERLVKEIRNMTEKNGARFQLMLIASPFSVMPSSVHGEIVPSYELDELDFDKPNRMLEEFATREGIDFVSLVPAFRARIGENLDEFLKLYLQCDGHWTPAGHRLAAELVAPATAAAMASESNASGEGPPPKPAP